MDVRFEAGMAKRHTTVVVERRYKQRTDTLLQPLKDGALLGRSLLEQLAKNDMATPRINLHSNPSRSGERRQESPWSKLAQSNHGAGSC